MQSQARPTPRSSDPPRGLVAESRSVLRWAHGRFGDRIVVASALGPQSIAILGLLHEEGIDLPVLFLDTDLHFPETYALIAAVEARLGLSIRRVRPRLSLMEQAERHGPRLWARDPDLCCALRKVRVLDEALAPYDAWISGLRSTGVGPRARVPLFDRDEARGLFKVNPLARWRRSQVLTFLAERDLPVSPLLERGYASVGCAPCTRPVADPSDERAGRWVGRGKTECGIHLGGSSPRTSSTRRGEPA